MTQRVVVLLDMDCFYVQVEERDHPNIKGVPAAVVQYNSWKGGGIIAVNYEARGFGVKRGMRGDEARSKCPDIQLIQVPVNRGKADLTKYRNAGKEVINVLCDYSDCIERASIDEAYIDFTNVIEERMKQLVGSKITSQMLTSTWVVGCDKTESEDKQGMQQNNIQNWLASLSENEDCASLITSEDPNWDNLRLTYAAALCEEMRRAVLERTSFKCSAGIAHNKMLAKLSCGFHKPNQQTVLPQSHVGELWESTEVGKVRNLGGKLGESLTEELGCVTMADLGRLSLHRLQGRYDDKTAHWLHNLGKGIDCEPVTSRQLPKSIGCGKNFQGREALNTRDKVQKWMLSLAEELSERLDIDQNANKRRAKTYTVTVRLDGDERWSTLSRSCGLPSYAPERIAQLGISLIQHTNQASSKAVWTPSIKHIGMSAWKFEDWAGENSRNIKDMLKKVANSAPKRRKPDPSTCKEMPKVLTSSILPASDEMLSSATSKTSYHENCESSVESKTEENHLIIHDVPSESFNRDKIKKYPYSCQNNIDHVSNETREVSESSSNSFFKNYILKKQRKADNSINCTSVSELYGHRVTNICNTNSEVKQGDIGECDENFEKSDLDLLLSCLNEDEIENTSSRSDSEYNIDKNKYVNRAKTEGNEARIQSKTSVNESPLSTGELGRTEITSGMEDFRNKYITEKSDGIEIEARSSKKHEVYENEIEKLDKSLHICPTNQLTENAISKISTALPGKELDELADVKIQDNQNSSISVQELFPDLDDFDLTLLPLLPRNLRHELERDLAHHKAKFDKKKSVELSGVSKYISHSPSKYTLLEGNTDSKPLNTKSSVSHPLAGPSKAGMPQDHNTNMKQSTINNYTNCATGDSNNTGNKMLCHENYSETDSALTKDYFQNIEHDSNKDLIQCKECDSQISPFELPEHLDYHVALKLQTDMQRERNLIPKQGTKMIMKTGSKRGKGKKRGRNDKIETNLKDKKIQKIDTFFKR